jgi:hypothetical protein
MALVVINKQLFLVLNLLDRKNSKKSNILQITSVILIGQVPQKILGEVLSRDIHLSKDNIGFIPGGRVIYHVSKGIGVMKGCIYFLVLNLCTQPERLFKFNR